MTTSSHRDAARAARRLGTFVFCLCAATAVTLRAGAAGPSDDRTRRLADEEARQRNVNADLKAVSDQLDALVEDLRSNNLYKQIEGDKMRWMKGIIQKVSKEHVPNAEEYLRKAMQELQNIRKHLAGADKEIQIILAELEKILGKAMSTIMNDQLLNELREIIKDQEQSRDQTKEWGKPIVENKTKPDERHTKQIADAQQQVSKKIEAFKDKPKNAAAKEQDPATKQRFENAAKMLSEKPIQQNSNEAAENVKKENPTGAVEKQDKVLQDLREIEQALEPKSPDAQNQQQNSELASKLQNIATELKTMAAQIENAAPQDFQAQKPQLQEQQGDLQDQMQQAAEQTQEKGQKEAIKKADKSMDKAKSETAQNNQPEAADALKEAAEALEPTIAQLALQAKQPMPSPIAPPFNPDPKEGPRHVQVSTKVEGATTAPDKSQWNPLSKKERESLFEKYSSQLPPEYRELLRAYYEALSK